MKTCQYCKEDVHDDALKCRYCHSMFLVPAHSSASTDDNHVTYILDRDLIRFAKFSAAVLAVFLIVGSYLFGFKLESALEKVSSTQEALKIAQDKMSLAQRELEEAQSITKNLKSEVEQVLTEAQSTLGAITITRDKAVKILDSMRTLTPEQQNELIAAKEQQPDKARSSMKGKWWEAGSTIRIRFLDGDSATQDKIKDIALEWLKYANLHFEFVSSGAADIRISLNKNQGAWSYLGTDALAIPTDEPTMNLGFIDKQTVLSQFGHALGLINEHNNPNANIAWNRDLVIREMSKPPYNWSKNMVKNHIFDKASKEQFPDYREFDPNSIMARSFPPSWTGGIKIEPGDDLSKSDKEFIAKMYPH